MSWLLSFPGFQSFCCYSHDCWDEEAGSGEEEILLVTDVLKPTGNGTDDVSLSQLWPSEFLFGDQGELGQQGSSCIMVFVPALRALPTQPHRFNARFQWLGPQCSLHGIQRNPGGRSRAEFWRQTEHGGTGKALRMRKVERGTQERAGKPGLWTWGKSAMNRNTHLKGSRQSHQRDTSQGQKQNKRLNGWKKLSREEFRTEAGEEKGENDVVLCCDRSVRSWVEDGQGREEKICWAHCCHTSCLVDSAYKEAS